MNNVTNNISKDSVVSLREITEKTVWSICKLSVKKQQEKFVAANSVSIAEAYFSKYAWFRAIYADDTPVGFLMLYDDPEKPEYYLWRFMIDARYQRIGFGKRALTLLIEHVKTRPNAEHLMTSAIDGNGNPKKFYEKMGFKLTGEYEDDEGNEALMKLIL